MCRHLILIVWFSSTAFFLNGQEVFVKGSVTGESNTPVEIGSVLVLSAKDSSYIKGTLLKNGSFQIPVKKSSRSLLKITSLGYHDKFISLFTEEATDTINVGTVEMKSKMLKEVEVSAKMPLVEVEAGKIIVNVQNTMLMSAGTAYDVLDVSPGIITSGNSIKVFNRGAAIIYIDGQRVPLSMLNSIPSSQIKKIEILSDPPANYDAQGGAVINIITRNNFLNGLQIELQEMLTVSRTTHNYTGINLFYKKQKLSVITRYLVLTGTRWAENEYNREFSSDGTISTTIHNTLEERKLYNQGGHYYGGSLKYDINPKSHVTFQLNGSYEGLNKTSIDINAISSGSNISSINVNTLSKQNVFNNSSNLSYYRRIDSLGSSVSVNCAYSMYQSAAQGNIQEVITDSSSVSFPKTTESKSNIGIGTTQVDLSKLFKSKLAFSSGLKGTIITNNSDIKFRRFQSSINEWVSDSALNNSFNYEEQCLAAYMQINQTIKRFYYRVGLRAEYTITKGVAGSTQKQNINRDYFNLFPSALTEYNWSKRFKTSISYSYRIKRPSYQDLNPFINYIDSLFSYKGNPFLLPEYNHNISTSFILNKKYSLDLSYVEMEDVMSLYIERVNGSNKLHGQIRNLKRGTSYSSSLNVPFEKKWWSTVTSVGYMISSFSFTNNVSSNINNTQNSYFIYTSNSFKLNKNWSLDLIFKYNSSNVVGIFITEPVYSLRGSIQYKALQGKLLVRVIANDLLNSFVTKGTAKFEGYKMSYSDRGDLTQFYRLFITYKLGRLKKKGHSESEINEDERGRIKN